MNKNNKDLKLTPNSSIVFNTYETNWLGQKITTKTIMSPECVQFFISDSGNPNPKKYGQNSWKNMDKLSRLVVNLLYSADNKNFEYQIVQ